MLALAEQCEAATGPDRELEIHIDCLVFGNGPITDDEARKFAQLDDELLDTRAYTASLDAAMTLVPEGAGVKIDTPNDTMRKHGFGAMPCGAAVHFGGNPETQAAAAATPALALCAAALRARAKETSDE